MKQQDKKQPPEAIEAEACIVGHRVNTPDLEPLFANHFELSTTGTDIYLDIGIVDPKDRASMLEKAPGDSGQAAKFSVLQRVAMSPAGFVHLVDKVNAAMQQIRRCSTPSASETDKLLARLSQLVDQVQDDDEPAPSEFVINEISSLIRQTSAVLNNSMPEGFASTFYGEVNVTWRHGDEIVRVACFPNRPALLQFGRLSQPLGTYQSQSNPSAEDVAARLDILVHRS